LSRLPIKHITRAHVAAHIRTIGKERGAVSANHARTTLSGMFTWAMKQGLVENNPVVATHRAVDEVARDRVLSGAELVAIWNACRDDDYGHIVRLLPDQVRWPRCRTPCVGRPASSMRGLCRAV
jgi:site-specific recombinase XerD